jgi:heme a synthase
MNKTLPVKINRPLHWFAVLTAVATFLLLGAGGLVTSHEAGMSVPDWPNSYGYNMFLFPPSKWIGGIFYEHTHRLWATVVGLMTTILMLWIYGKGSRVFMRWLGIILPVIGIASEIFLWVASKSEIVANIAKKIISPHYPQHRFDGILDIVIGLVFLGASFFWPRCERSPKWLVWLGVAAFLAVVTQGVLGGLRVDLINPQLGIFHGILAQAFFALVCAIALFTSRFWLELSAREKIDFVPRGLRSHVLYVTILIFLQLALGATMRHQHAGLSISDFPLAHGKIWPDTSAAAIARYNAERMDVVAENPITAFQVILQMIHRLVALLIFLGVAAASGLAVKRLGKKDSLTKLAFFWLMLIIGQIGLGIETIWSNKAADIATAHVLVGALSLVTGVLWCLIAFGRRVPVVETESTAIFGVQPSLAGGK